MNHCLRWLDLYDFWMMLIVLLKTCVELNIAFVLFAPQENEVDVEKEEETIQNVSI